MQSQCIVLWGLGWHSPDICHMPNPNQCHIRLFCLVMWIRFTFLLFFFFLPLSSFGQTCCFDSIAYMKWHFFFPSCPTGLFLLPSVFLLLTIFLAFPVEKSYFESHCGNILKLPENRRLYPFIGSYWKIQSPSPVNNLASLIGNNLYQLSFS